MNGATPVTGTGSVLGKTLGFSLAMILLFTLVANMLPQVEGEAPKEEPVDLGALTMESYIALGESLFSGKGTCTLCHNELGRAPDLLKFDAVAAAGERLADTRYQGTAKDAEAYLRESMLDPNVYVVAGFGKKGSNDTESPMPIVDKPPIQLDTVEIDAIIAFLQAKDGNDVSVALPTEAPAAEAAATPGATAAPVAATTAEEAIVKYGCQACHTVLGTESPVGPPLTGIGQRLKAGQIRQGIIDPNAIVAEGFFPNVMPADFADRMTARELELLVAFLSAQEG